MKNIIRRRLSTSQVGGLSQFGGSKIKKLLLLLRLLLLLFLFYLLLLLLLNIGVHGTRTTPGNSKLWRSKPLLRREGDKVFKTGTEAANLLLSEAIRRDDVSSTPFIQLWTNLTSSLAVVFDRMPKYAWIMKQLLEPERTITFRVAWIDDSGVSRVNRGYRIQYSSALGPYEGGLAFSPRVNLSLLKAAALDTTFRNALSSKPLGGAFGGADFNPYTKSETEIQRFCQSYMTELAKYIGPDTDLPGLGEGVTNIEVGYMYGQYKRINHHCGQVGKGLMWGGSPVHVKAQGYGIAYFAKKMLEDKGQSLEGKKCLITGSHYVALALAEKLLQFGAIPLTFSDLSGFVYEPNGFDNGKLKVIEKIKNERGASIGRYIIASTSAKFNEPSSNIFDIPCDFVFTTSSAVSINENDITSLASKGCKGIIEGGGLGALTNEGLIAAKKKSMLLAPARATSVGSVIFNGMEMEADPLKPGETIDSRVEAAVDVVFEEIKRTAKEFNTRGDLHVGANIAAFLKVADAMFLHGSV